MWTHADSIEYVISDYLDEYQQQVISDIISGFGTSTNACDVIENFLYVWFGMGTESFIDTYCEVEY